MRFRLALALGALVAVAFAGVWVNTALSDDDDPADAIGGTRGGTVDGLIVLDDRFDRWYVAQVEQLKVEADVTVTFRYYTSSCEEMGLVGYAVDYGEAAVRLTIVAGESGSSCGDAGIPHAGTVTLNEPVGARRLVAVEPRTESSHQDPTSRKDPARGTS